jgi:CHAT domain-containing protein/tetratricopeptide (TPR) repeat protein
MMFRASRNRAAAVLAAAFVLLPASHAARLSAQQSGVAQSLIAQAEDLRKEKKEAEALETADRALEAATQLGDRLNEADAARLAARILYSMGRYTESMKRAETARGAAIALNDRTREAQALHGMGNAAWGLGTRADARQYFAQAIALYRDLRMTREALRAIHGLWLVSDISPDTDKMLNEAIEEAVATKDTTAEGLLRQDAGDEAFNQARYADAFAQLQKARQLAEDAEDRPQLALVLTSIGRLYRAHGEVDQAIELYRGALAMQEQTNNIYGQVQSLNAIGATYERLNRMQDALEMYERAIVVAQQLESPRVTRFLIGARASALVELGKHAEALPILLSVLEGEEQPYLRAIRRRNVAAAYLHLGDPRAALDQIDKEIAGTREAKYLDELPRALALRAQIRERLGDIDGALADAQEAAAQLEEMRRNLVPSDFMKRGFAQWNELIYGVNIALATRKGDTPGSFIAAEQARARALLDLLALRAELRRARSAVDTGPQPTAGPIAIGTRTDLASPLSAAAPSLERLAATAARLHSTILSYWVGDDATFLWVMTPEGQLRLRRIAATRQQIEALVRQTLPAAASDAKPSAATTVAARGAALELPAAPLVALRKLHTLLIEPAEALLPASGRLTIVPHGPLFKLSFVALTDKRGKYLIERFAVHYAPSATALEFTSQTSAHARQDGYLLVADPAPLPSILDPIDGRPRPLPPLPGSTREARAIAALLPPDETTMLDGARASEAQVKAALHGKRVLHLATHGVIRDAEPLASFIAVGETGREPGADGRLTAEELYDVDLDSDLVVLSACRSADGQVSGDGIFGLTRALLSAGTSSVIASAWAVADEPTAQMMPAFYKEWLRTGSKIDSLRHAQLALIRNLRAGRVSAQTPIGRITLSEHPLFWAGFMLIGEPK